MLAAFSLHIGKTMCPNTHLIKQEEFDVAYQGVCFAPKLPQKSTCLGKSDERNYQSQLVLRGCFLLTQSIPNYLPNHFVQGEMSWSKQCSSVLRFFKTEQHCENAWKDESLQRFWCPLKHQFGGSDVFRGLLLSCRSKLTHKY